MMSIVICCETTKDIHNNLFMEHSNSVCSHKRAVVDCDQTGIMQKGKTFALFENDYFAKKKN
jgi:hypothetical protein